MPIGTIKTEELAFLDSGHTLSARPKVVMGLLLTVRILSFQILFGLGIWVWTVAKDCVAEMLV